MFMSIHCWHNLAYSGIEYVFTHLSIVAVNIFRSFFRPWSKSCMARWWAGKRRDWQGMAGGMVGKKRPVFFGGLTPCFLRCLMIFEGWIQVIDVFGAGFNLPCISWPALGGDAGLKSYALVARSPNVRKTSSTHVGLSENRVYSQL